jgi:hypothetical protein
VASGLRTPDPSGDAGGLIVMVRPDPADAARAIADDLHAELAIGGLATERALQRLHARQLEHRDLDELSAAMRRAEAIRDRTREAIAAQVSASLNTKVAIHPDTLRRAATELLAAQLALDAAQRRDRRRVRRLARAGASWLRLRRATPPSHASLAGHVALARSRWEQVAGVGADPHQVEAIIHRYDPQDPIVATLSAQHPAMRAAERAAVARRMAWVAAWRQEVGDATPITDPAVTELLQRDDAQLWLSGDGAPDEPETLVVAAPYADLPESRARELHRHLLGLPRGKRVIVVLAPDPVAPLGVRIPGASWAPTLRREELVAAGTARPFPPRALPVRVPGASRRPGATG